MTDGTDTAAEWTSTDAPLLAERIGEVAVVTLHRPEVRNALDAQLISRLAETWVRLGNDDTVRAVVLTGTDPAFCAGVDLRALGAGDLGLVLPRAQRGPLPVVDVPVIGAVNGPAVTGGLELALACDFLVASERARFADTHARVGVMPGWGMSVLLPEAVGLRRAREMSVTGRFVAADTAAEWGLVNHVVAHDELLPTALALAGEVTGAEPAAVAQLLATYRNVTATTVDAGWDLEAELSHRWASEHLDPAAVERRRRGVIERGRNQL